MRELTLKGYLEQQFCELSDCKSKSLYKFADLAQNNARLKDVLCLYLSLYVDDKLKNQLTKKFTYLSVYCERLSGKSPDDFDDSLSEYKTIYENYLNRKSSKQNDNKLKKLMQKRIVELKTEKGISNYRIYKALNLNPGNVNAFLKNADVSKVGLNTVRKMLAYVNE
ncbi:MAG: hypothetical protein IJ903_08125 [Ruminococcus sp.]|nr:hypothetical protein [Ruminococcus sp.]